MPSRVIAIRVPEELKAQLDELVKSRGWSYRDFISFALSSWEAEQREMEESLEEAYQEGYRKARHRYGIPSFCSRCGKLGYLDEPGARARLSELVNAWGWFWHHPRCPWS